MIGVKLIAPGTLKEAYLRDAAAEYTKRLGGLCRFETVQLKEEKLPDEPSEAQIHTALEKEGEKILSLIPARAYCVAMCVEGDMLSSEALAAQIEKAGETRGELCFVIGSSYGLSDSVKKRADLRLSVSRLTFPHQLMRVILLEALYRSFQILRGSKYHK